MARLVQAVAFFVLLGVGYVVFGPFSTGGAILAFLLSWSITAATITHVLPWLYFRLTTKPVSSSDRRDSPERGR